MSNRINVFKGAFAIVLSSFLWGTTGTAASYAPTVSSLAIGAFAMGIGGVLLVFSARRKLLVDFKKIMAYPKMFLLGGISVAIYPLAFYTSMRLAGVAIGTVVSIASAPFFSAILERLISKKTVSLQWMISFLIGAIGICFLAVGKDQHGVIPSSFFLQNIGILLGFIAGLTYASYSWVAKHLIEDGIHSQSSMAGLFGVAALFLIPSLWFTGRNIFSSGINISVSLYMAIIPMFVGYLLFGFGLKFIDASRATLITLIEPLVATILAVYIVGEKLQIIGWLGMSLVLLCLLLQTFKLEILSKATPIESQ